MTSINHKAALFLCLLLPENVVDFLLYSSSYYGGLFPVLGVRFL